MDLYFLILTAASASLDAFFAGIAIGAENKSCLQRKIFAIMAVVSAMCALSFIAADALSPILGNSAQRVGGFILLLVGIAGAWSAIKEDNRPVFVRKRQVTSNFWVILHGVGIGMDGACATASLALAGYSVISAAVISALHLVLLELGSAFAWIKLPHILKNCLAPSLLIALGIFKII